MVLTIPARRGLCRCGRGVRPCCKLTPCRPLRARTMIMFPTPWCVSCSSVPHLTTNQEGLVSKGVRIILGVRRMRRVECGWFRCRCRCAGRELLRRWRSGRYGCVLARHLRHDHCWTDCQCGRWHPGARSCGWVMPSASCAAVIERARGQRSQRRALRARVVHMRQGFAVFRACHIRREAA